MKDHANADDDTEYLLKELQKARSSLLSGGKRFSATIEGAQTLPDEQMRKARENAERELLAARAGLKKLFKMKTKEREFRNLEILTRVAKFDISSIRFVPASDGVLAEAYPEIGVIAINHDFALRAPPLQLRIVIAHELLHHIYPELTSEEAIHEMLIAYMRHQNILQDYFLYAVAFKHNEFGSPDFRINILPDWRSRLDVAIAADFGIDWLRENSTPDAGGTAKGVDIDKLFENVMRMRNEDDIAGIILKMRSDPLLLGEVMTEFSARAAERQENGNFEAALRIMEFLEFVDEDRVAFGVRGQLGSIYLAMNEKKTAGKDPDKIIDNLLNAQRYYAEELAMAKEEYKRNSRDKVHLENNMRVSFEALDKVCATFVEMLEADITVESDKRQDQLNLLMKYIEERRKIINESRGLGLYEGDADLAFALLELDTMQAKFEMGDPEYVIEKGPPVLQTIQAGNDMDAVVRALEIMASAYFHMSLVEPALRERVEETINRIFAIEENNVNAHLNKIMLLVAAGRYTEAIAWSERVCDTTKASWDDFTQIRIIRAHLLVREGRFVEAGRFLIKKAQQLAYDRESLKMNDYMDETSSVHLISAIMAVREGDFNSVPDLEIVSKVSPVEYDCFLTQMYHVRYGSNDVRTREQVERLFDKIDGNRPLMIWMYFLMNAENAEDIYGMFLDIAVEEETDIAVTKNIMLYLAGFRHTGSVNKMMKYLRDSLAEGAPISSKTLFVMEALLDVQAEGVVDYMREIAEKLDSLGRHAQADQTLIKQMRQMIDKDLGSLFTAQKAMKDRNYKDAIKAAQDIRRTFADNPLYSDNDRREIRLTADRIIAEAEQALAELKAMDEKKKAFISEWKQERDRLNFRRCQEILNELRGFMPDYPDIDVMIRRDAAMQRAYEQYQKGDYKEALAELNSALPDDVQSDELPSLLKNIKRKSKKSKKTSNGSDPNLLYKPIRILFGRITAAQGITAAMAAGDLLLARRLLENEKYFDKHLLDLKISLSLRYVPINLAAADEMYYKDLIPVVSERRIVTEDLIKLSVSLSERYLMTGELDTALEALDTLEPLVPGDRRLFYARESIARARQRSKQLEELYAARKFIEAARQAREILRITKEDKRALLLGARAQAEILLSEFMAMNQFIDRYITANEEYMNEANAKRIPFKKLGIESGNGRVIKITAETYDDTDARNITGFFFRLCDKNGMNMFPGQIFQSTNGETDAGGRNEKKNNGVLKLKLYGQPTPEQEKELKENVVKKGADGGSIEWIQDSTKIIERNYLQRIMYELQNSLSGNFFPTTGVPILDLKYDLDVTRAAWRKPVKKLAAETIQKYEAQLNKLDAYQRSVVIDIIEKATDPDARMVLAQGPPGTGKTRTLTVLVDILVDLGFGVIIKSKQHVAVDNVLKGLACPYVRVGNTGNKVDVEVAENWMGRSQKLHDILNGPRKGWVIGGTDIGVINDKYLMSLDFYAQVKAKRAQVVVLEDEMGISHDSLSLPSDMLANTLVYIGDEKQLRPHGITDEEVKTIGLKYRGFEPTPTQRYLFSASLFERMIHKAIPHHLLRVAYRFTPVLLGLIADTYDFKLLPRDHDRPEKEEPSEGAFVIIDTHEERKKNVHSRDWFSRNDPYAEKQTRSVTDRFYGQTRVSLMNVKEAELIVRDYVAKLKLKNGEQYLYEPKDMLIITFYKAQVENIMRLFNQEISLSTASQSGIFWERGIRSIRQINVKDALYFSEDEPDSVSGGAPAEDDSLVASIKAIQGAEARTVFVSCVQSNRDRSIRGFTIDPQQLNVAFSRMKEEIRIYGDFSYTLSQGVYYGKSRNREMDAAAARIRYANYMRYAGLVRKFGRRAYEILVLEYLRENRGQININGRSERVWRSVIDQVENGDMEIVYDLDSRYGFVLKDTAGKKSNYDLKLPAEFLSAADDSADYQGSFIFDGFGCITNSAGYGSLEIVIQRLAKLEKLLGRAPPVRWTLIVTNDPTVTNGNVAACNIEKKEIYLHRYFFRLNEEGRKHEALKPSDLQLKILYHELISHIVKGLPDPTAGHDTDYFAEKYLRDELFISDLNPFQIPQTPGFPPMIWEILSGRTCTEPFPGVKTRNYVKDGSSYYDRSNMIDGSGFVLGNLVGTDAVFYNDLKEPFYGCCMVGVKAEDVFYFSHTPFLQSSDLIRKILPVTIGKKIDKIIFSYSADREFYLSEIINDLIKAGIGSEKIIARIHRGANNNFGSNSSLGFLTREGLWVLSGKHISDSRQVNAIDFIDWNANGSANICFADMETGGRAFLDVVDSPFAIKAIEERRIREGIAEPLLLGSDKRGREGNLTEADLSGLSDAVQKGSCIDLPELTVSLVLFLGRHCSWLEETLRAAGETRKLPLLDRVVIVEEKVWRYIGITEDFRGVIIRVEGKNTLVLTSSGLESVRAQNNDFIFHEILEYARSLSGSKDGHQFALTALKDRGEKKDISLENRKERQCAGGIKSMDFGQLTKVLDVMQEIGLKNAPLCMDYELLNYRWEDKCAADVLEALFIRGLKADLITHGWGPDNLIAQRAAEKVARLPYDFEVLLSLHTWHTDVMNKYYDSSVNKYVNRYINAVQTFLNGHGIYHPAPELEISVPEYRKIFYRFVYDADEFFKEMNDFQARVLEGVQAEFNIPGEKWGVEWRIGRAARLANAHKKPLPEEYLSGGQLPNTDFRGLHFVIGHDGNYYFVVEFHPLDRSEIRELTGDLYDEIDVELVKDIPWVKWYSIKRKRDSRQFDIEFLHELIRQMYFAPKGFIPFGGRLYHFLERKAPIIQTVRGCPENCLICLYDPVMEKRFEKNKTSQRQGHNGAFKGTRDDLTAAVKKAGHIDVTGEMRSSVHARFKEGAVIVNDITMMNGLRAPPQSANKVWIVDLNVDYRSVLIEIDKSLILCLSPAFYKEILVDPSLLTSGIIIHESIEYLTGDHEKTVLIERQYHSSNDEYLTISKFSHPNFSYDKLRSKSQALLAYEGKNREIVRKFVLNALQDMAIAVERGRSGAGDILGLAGEISGLYEVLIKRGTCLNHINLGRLNAVRHIFIDKNGMAKEFDAVSSNSIFEFKFTLSLKKLYQQVIGIDSAKSNPHLEILIKNREFDGIRNIVYFGENDGGFVIKAIVEFLEKNPQIIRRVKISTTRNGGISVKFDLKDMKKFLLDEATISFAETEDSNKWKRAFFVLRQDKYRREIEQLIDAKLAQLKAGEHFDVIIGVSRTGDKELQRMRKLEVYSNRSEPVESGLACVKIENNSVKDQKQSINKEKEALSILKIWDNWNRIGERHFALTDDERSVLRSLSRPKLLRFWQNDLPNNVMLYYVGSAQRPVAIAYLYEVEELSTRSIYIHTIETDESVKSRGFGWKLLEEIIKDFGSRYGLSLIADRRSNDDDPDADKKHAEWIERLRTAGFEDYDDGTLDMIRPAMPANRTGERSGARGYLSERSIKVFQAGPESSFDVFVRHENIREGFIRRSGQNLGEGIPMNVCHAYGGPNMRYWKGGRPVDWTSGGRWDRNEKAADIRARRVERFLPQNRPTGNYIPRLPFGMTDWFIPWLEPSLRLQKITRQFVKAYARYFAEWDYPAMQIHPMNDASCLATLTMLGLPEKLSRDVVALFNTPKEFYKALVQTLDIIDGLGAKEPEWFTANSIMYEQTSMRLREFNGGNPGNDIPMLIVPPNSGHTSMIADYGDGKSIVQTFKKDGRTVYSVDWKSADPKYIQLIDDMVQDVVNAIDAVGGKVQLVGLCQGGWVALIVAALYPEKVAALYLSGSPIDATRGENGITEVAKLDPEFFNWVVYCIGKYGVYDGLTQLWGFKSLGPNNGQEKKFDWWVELLVNIAKGETGRINSFVELMEWYEYTLDLSLWFLHCIEDLFKGNKLFKGELYIQVGDELRLVDLKQVTCPVVLMEGTKDDITPSASVRIHQLAVINDIGDETSVWEALKKLKLITDSGEKNINRKPGEWAVIEDAMVRMDWETFRTLDNDVLQKLPVDTRLELYGLLSQCRGQCLAAEEVVGTPRGHVFKYLLNVGHIGLYNSGKCQKVWSGSSKKVDQIIAGKGNGGPSAPVSGYLSERNLNAFRTNPEFPGLPSSHKNLRSDFTRRTQQMLALGIPAGSRFAKGGVSNGKVHDMYALQKRIEQLDRSEPARFDTKKTGDLLDDIRDFVISDSTGPVSARSLFEFLMVKLYSHFARDMQRYYESLVIGFYPEFSMVDTAARFASIVNAMLKKNQEIDREVMKILLVQLAIQYIEFHNPDFEETAELQAAVKALRGKHGMPGEFFVVNSIIQKQAEMLDEREIIAETIKDMSEDDSECEMELRKKVSMSIHDQIKDFIHNENSRPCNDLEFLLRRRPEVRNEVNYLVSLRDQMIELCDRRRRLSDSIGEQKKNLRREVVKLVSTMRGAGGFGFSLDSFLGNDRSEGEERPTRGQHGDLTRSQEKQILRWIELGRLIAAPQYLKTVNAVIAQGSDDFRRQVIARLRHKLQPNAPSVEPCPVLPVRVDQVRVLTEKQINDLKIPPTFTMVLVRAANGEVILVLHPAVSTVLPKIISPAVIDHEIFELTAAELGSPDAHRTAIDAANEVPSGALTDDHLPWETLAKFRRKVLFYSDFMRRTLKGEKWDTLSDFALYDLWHVAYQRDNAGENVVWVDPVNDQTVMGTNALLSCMGVIGCAGRDTAEKGFLFHQFQHSPFYTPLLKIQLDAHRAAMADTRGYLEKKAEEIAFFVKSYCGAPGKVIVIVYRADLAKFMPDYLKFIRESLKPARLRIIAVECPDCNCEPGQQQYIVSTKDGFAAGITSVRKNDFGQFIVDKEEIFLFTWEQIKLLLRGGQDLLIKTARTDKVIYHHERVLKSSHALSLYWFNARFALNSDNLIFQDPGPGILEYPWYLDEEISMEVEPPCPYANDVVEYPDFIPETAGTLGPEKLFTGRIDQASVKNKPAIPNLSHALDLSEEIIDDKGCCESREARLFIHRNILSQLSPIDIERIEAAVRSEYQIDRNTRSVEFELVSPFDRTEVLQIKGIYFDSRREIIEHDGIGGADCYEPDDKGFIRYVRKDDQKPQGALPLARAVNEFILTDKFYYSSINDDQIEFKVPVGWGWFPGIEYQGQDLGFIILGMSKKAAAYRCYMRNPQVLYLLGRALSIMQDEGLFYLSMHEYNLTVRYDPLFLTIHDLEASVERRNFKDPNVVLAWAFIDLQYALDKVVGLLESDGMNSERSVNLNAFLGGYFGNDDEDFLAGLFVEDAQRDIENIRAAAERRLLIDQNHPLIKAIHKKMTAVNKLAVDTNVKMFAFPERIERENRIHFSSDKAAGPFPSLDDLRLSVRILNMTNEQAEGLRNLFWEEVEYLGGVEEMMKDPRKTAEHISAQGEIDVFYLESREDWDRFGKLFSFLDESAFNAAFSEYFRRGAGIFIPDENDPLFERPIVFIRPDVLYDPVLALLHEWFEWKTYKAGVIDPVCRDNFKHVNMIVVEMTLNLAARIDKSLYFKIMADTVKAPENINADGVELLRQFNGFYEEYLFSKNLQVTFNFNKPLTFYPGTGPAEASVQDGAVKRKIEILGMPDMDNSVPVKRENKGQLGDDRISMINIFDPGMVIGLNLSKKMIDGGKARYEYDIGFESGKGSGTNIGNRVYLIVDETSKEIDMPVIYTINGRSSRNLKGVGLSVLDFLRKEALRLGFSFRVTNIQSRKLGKILPVFFKGLKFAYENSKGYDPEAIDWQGWMNCNVLALPKTDEEVRSALKLPHTSFDEKVFGSIPVNNDEIGVSFETLDIIPIFLEEFERYYETIREKGLTLRIPEVNAVLTAKRIDVDLLRMALREIIENAIRYTDEGEIRLELDPATENGPITARIIDTGVGIPEEDIGKIFDDFYRGSNVRSVTKGGGMGLGMARRALQEIMGGSLSVRSEEGKGTTVTIVLPADELSEKINVMGMEERPFPGTVAAETYDGRMIGRLDSSKGVFIVREQSFGSDDERQYYFTLLEYETAGDQSSERKAGALSFTIKNEKLIVGIGGDFDLFIEPQYRSVGAGHFLLGLMFMKALEANAGEWRIYFHQRIQSILAKFGFTNEEYHPKVGPYTSLNVSYPEKTRNVITGVLDETADKHGTVMRSQLIGNGLDDGFAERLRKEEQMIEARRRRWEKEGISGP
jgi:poly-beta-hydroxyalkanoate depolymerase